MELDEQTKTPALVLSADRLEASNPNWTFESVHATLCVGRGMCAVPPYPSGWYYEVTLKSTGILQIGTCILRPIFASLPRNRFSGRHETLPGGALRDDYIFA